MPLVSQYAHLRKPNVAGLPSEMWPLRAVGLACERGHRLCAQQSLGRLTPGALLDIHVSGHLQLLDQSTWRSARSCTLRLRVDDANLAWTLVRRQRAYLNDLGLNCWAADSRVGKGMPSYDLVGDFSMENSWVVTGRVWVELKVLAARGFDAKVAQHRQELEKKFAKAQETDTSLDAVLLVFARCGASGASWQEPRVSGQLLCSAGPFAGTWVDPAPGIQRDSPRRPVGRCQAAKPPLNTVLAEMEWAPHPNGSAARLGLLSHFFATLKLPKENVPKRAASFNKRLGDAGVVDRLAKVFLRDRGGRAIWVAPKRVFRKLYGFV